jgi:hypothetical protein
MMRAAPDMTGGPVMQSGAAFGCLPSLVRLLPLAARVRAGSGNGIGIMR